MEVFLLAPEPDCDIAVVSATSEQTSKDRIVTQHLWESHIYSSDRLCFFGTKPHNQDILENRKCVHYQRCRLSIYKLVLGPTSWPLSHIDVLESKF